MVRMEDIDISNEDAAGKRKVEEEGNERKFNEFETLLKAVEVTMEEERRNRWLKFQQLLAVACYEKKREEEGAFQQDMAVGEEIRNQEAAYQEDRSLGEKELLEEGGNQLLEFQQTLSVGYNENIRNKTGSQELESQQLFTPDSLVDKGEKRCKQDLEIQQAGKAAVVGDILEDERANGKCLRPAQPSSFDNDRDPETEEAVRRIDSGKVTRSSRAPKRKHKAEVKTSIFRMPREDFAMAMKIHMNKRQKLKYRPPCYDGYLHENGLKMTLKLVGINYHLTEDEASNLHKELKGYFQEIAKSHRLLEQMRYLHRVQRITEKSDLTTKAIKLVLRKTKRIVKYFSNKLKLTALIIMEKLAMRSGVALRIVASGPNIRCFFRLLECNKSAPLRDQAMWFLVTVVLNQALMEKDFIKHLIWLSKGNRPQSVRKNVSFAMSVIVNSAPRSALKTIADYILKELPTDIPQHKANLLWTLEGLVKKKRQGGLALVTIDHIRAMMACNLEHRKFWPPILVILSHCTSSQDHAKMVVESHAMWEVLHLMKKRIPDKMVMGILKSLRNLCSLSHAEYLNNIGASQLLQQLIEHKDRKIRVSTRKILNILLLEVSRRNSL